MTKPTIGERLRRARESSGASIHEAGRQTRIRVDFLDYMERDNFRFMSGGTYIRGLLRAYAQWLGLDDAELAGQFDQTYGTPRGPSVSQILKKPSVPPPRRRWNWTIAAVVAAAVLVVLSLVGVMDPVGPDRVAEVPSTSEVAGSDTGNAGEVAEASPEAPLFEGVQVTVGVIGDRCWMLVVADGDDESPIFEGTLFEGANQSFEADQELRIVFGNLGGIDVTVNGRELGTPGSPGQTGTFLFGRDTTSFTRV